jgi:hypothetical protein
MPASGRGSSSGNSGTAADLHLRHSQDFANCRHQTVVLFFIQMHALTSYGECREDIYTASKPHETAHVLTKQIPVPDIPSHHGLTLVACLPHNDPLGSTSQRCRCGQASTK